MGAYQPCWQADVNMFELRRKVAGLRPYEDWAKACRDETVSSHCKAPKVKLSSMLILPIAIGPMITTYLILESLCLMLAIDPRYLRSLLSDPSRRAHPREAVAVDLLQRERAFQSTN
jgi:hypothetical protein